MSGTVTLWCQLVPCPILSSEVFDSLACSTVYFLQEIADGFQYPHDHGVLEANKHKNRFINIIACKWARPRALAQYRTDRLVLACVAVW